MNLREKIEELCKDKNLTLISLEREVDLGRGSIRRWDENLPAIDKVQKIADYFSISIDNLLDRESVISEKVNPDIIMIAKASRNMTPEQIENLRKYAQFMFPEAFIN